MRKRLLDDPVALADGDRRVVRAGFHATVDLHRIEVPQRIDLATGEITCRTKKVFRIEVRYPPSDIRRGH